MSEPEDLNPFDQYIREALGELRDLPQPPYVANRVPINLNVTKPITFDPIPMTQTAREWRPSQPVPEIRKASTYVNVSHELACDLGWHTCDASCPPVPVHPMPTHRERARWKVRTIWRWLTGLRIAHRSRIDQNQED